MQRLTMDYRMKVQRLDIPKGHRIILTSDIHGKLSYLKGLLQKLAFSPEDYLLIAGDVTDKGEESLATIRYLTELKKSYPVYMVYGNVDAKVVEYLETPELFYQRYCFMMENWGNCIYNEMLKEQGLFLKEEGARSLQAVEMERMAKEKRVRQGREIDVEDAWSLIRSRYEKELRFIQELPVLIDAGAFLVTHAGLYSDPYKEWTSDEVKKMVNWDSFQDEEIYFSRYVFVGHWPVTIYEGEQMDSSPVINRKKKIVSLDGGCVVKRDGQLNAVVLPDIGSEEFKIESYDHFPKARVLEDRKGGGNAFYVRWNNRFVERLKEDEEGSLVRFLKTGEEHWVPRAYLWDEGKGLCCTDYTDYEMPLHAGEEVSVIGSYKRGYLVRKNGASGWYYGKLSAL